jgi:hypothetical protein
MLHFLSSLFAGSPPKTRGPDETLVKAAVERLVDGTDRRLRGLRNYHKRLRGAVETAVIHVIELVDSLPDAVEISRSRYGSDPCLRAFFSSADNLQTTIGTSKAIDDFVKAAKGDLPEKIFGVLSMEWVERKVLGVDLDGDLLRREVPQVVVNFFHHRYFEPAATEADNRHLVKVRIYDYLIQRALESILAARSKRSELESERLLLQRKLAAMKQGNWGLENMLAESEQQPPDLATLETEIDAVDMELGELGSRSEELEQNLEHITEIMANASAWIDLRKTCMVLNSMSVKVDDVKAAGANQLELIELFSWRGESRIVLPGYFLRQDLPERPDFFKEAQRYLG